MLDLAAVQHELIFTRGLQLPPSPGGRVVPPRLLFSFWVCHENDSLSPVERQMLEHYSAEAAAVNTIDTCTFSTRPLHFWTNCSLLFCSYMPHLKQYPPANTDHSIVSNSTLAAQPLKMHRKQVQHTCNTQPQKRAF